MLEECLNLSTLEREGIRFQRIAEKEWISVEKIFMNLGKDYNGGGGHYEILLKCKRKEVNIIRNT